MAIESYLKWNKLMDSQPNQREPDSSDSAADACAGVALVLLFVVTCVFWVAGQ